MPNSNVFVDDKVVSKEDFPTIIFNTKNANSKIFVKKPKRIKNILVTDKGSGDSYVNIGRGVNIINHLHIDFTTNCTINIGDNCTIGTLDILIDTPNITINIGNDCLIGFGVTIRSGDGHTIYDINSKLILNHPDKQIIIGDHVWIGRNVSILKNAAISSNTIVGMNSVVTKKFASENCILAGIPAKIVKNGVNWSIKPSFAYKDGYYSE